MHFIGPSELPMFSNHLMGPSDDTQGIKLSPEHPIN